MTVMLGNDFLPSKNVENLSLEREGELSAV